MATKSNKIKSLLGEKSPGKLARLRMLGEQMQNKCPTHKLAIIRTLLKSGAKATAVQTLTRLPSVFHFARRLDCGAFTAAFPLESVSIWVKFFASCPLDERPGL